MPVFSILTGKFPVKIWTPQIESAAQQQLVNLSSLDIIYHHIAAMPDVHWGLGATVGSVIPSKKAIIPAAVGVDLGCGMMALQLNLKSSDLPDHLYELRSSIEKAVPHGRTHQGGRNDRGAWNQVPKFIQQLWKERCEKSLKQISEKHSGLFKNRVNTLEHLGTLGTGNHFIELCLDENECVWIMLHSGSRGIGNRIGTYFIELAKKEMGQLLGNLPDKDLAYFRDGSKYFHDYIEAVSWAQQFAKLNREIMMDAVLNAVRHTLGREDIQGIAQAINCHHNYIAEEFHFGSKVWITRKGAIRAGVGELGIIPGSMGAKSFIVRGKGNQESFESCSHGSGRKMSRNEAKKRFSEADLRNQTSGVECRKDKDVLDEIPGAYKDIDEVMANQSDLVEVVHTLKQVLCVKG